jgi:ABC-type transport system involved in multi-copper enzyme maturation permease subunit
MKSLWFDLLSALKSKLAIGLLLVILLLSVVSAAGISVSQVSPGQTANLYHAYYYENGTYHIVNFVYDSYGNPVDNINIHLNVSGRHESHITDNAGFANLSVTGLNRNQTYTVIENYTYLESEYSIGFTLLTSELNYTSENYNIYTVYNQRDPYLMNILLVYTGKNGSTSGPVDVYIAQNSVERFNATPVLVGTATNFNDVVIVPPENLLSPDVLYSITVVPFNASGAVLRPDQVAITGYTLETAVPSKQLAYQAAGIVDGSYLFVAAIVSVVAAYSFYGRIVTTGSAEGTVSKPITRKQLFISRYFATQTLLLSMSVLTMGSMDLYAYVVTGFWISAIPILEMILGIFLSNSALAGFAMLISSSSKSDLLAIGIPLVLAIVLSVMWGEVIQSVDAALGLSGNYVFLHKSEYMNVWVLLYYLNPLGAQTLTSSMITGYSGIFSVSFSSYRPTVLRVFFIGVIWVVIAFSFGLVKSSATD